MGEDILRGIAETLKYWPDVRSRLRAAHQPGPDGRCLGCRSPVHLGPMWPCRLALVSGADSPPPAA
jgi:hypothetical protein